MNDGERRRKLSRVELVAHQAATHLTATLEALRDAMNGQPGAASYDGVGGVRLVTWCWDHGKEVEKCRRAGLECLGESFEVDDPTGEAAMDPDKAKDSLDRLDKALSRMADAAEVVVDVVKEWRPPTREQGERLAAAFAKLLEPGDPSCEVCARKGHYSPPHVEASTCKDNLPRPYRLCVWCYRWVLAHGRLPTDGELAAHHQGKKPRVRAS